MIRIIRFHRNQPYYGCKLPENLEEAMEEIETFIREGTPVIVVDDLDDLEFGLEIDPNDIEMVEKDSDDE